MAEAVLTGKSDFSQKDLDFLFRKMLDAKEMQRSETRALEAYGT